MAHGRGGRADGPARSRRGIFRSLSSGRFEVVPAGCCGTVVQDLGLQDIGRRTAWSLWHATCFLIQAASVVWAYDRAHIAVIPTGLPGYVRL